MAGFAVKLCQGSEVTRLERVCYLHPAERPPASSPRHLERLVGALLPGLLRRVLLQLALVRELPLLCLRPPTGGKYQRPGDSRY